MSDSNAPGQPGDPDGVAGPPPVPPPSEPSVAAPDAQPTQAFPPSSDAQPTEAFPPASDARTAPASDAQPTEAYAPAAYPVGGQPQYPGQPGYDSAQPADAGSPTYAASPGGGVASGDSRPRTLAIAALVAAVVGVLLSLGGFIPVPGLATVLVVIGGLLLLAGFVLGLVVLISKAQGGKALGITAVVVSVLGGILFIVALFASLLWIGLAASNRDGALVDPSPTATTAPSQEASETPSQVPSQDSSEEPSASAPPAGAGTYDEAAYLAAVRPEINALIQEIEPDITDEQLAEVYSDETLVTLGKSFAALGLVEGGNEAARGQFIEASAGTFTEEQAGRFFDSISTAAQQYLVE